jgi:YbbR domain-containing protein
MIRWPKPIWRLVTDNFLWKLLSLALAVLLWAVVSSEPEMSTFATVRLLFKNMPDDLEFASEPVNSISLELRGPSGTLGGIGNDNLHPQVVLDMSGVGPGQRTFSINRSNVRLNRGISLVSARPSEVRFDFEHKANRTVPVEVRFANQGEHGYVVAHYEVNPPELPVAGPASHVARISAVVTDPVDVSSVVGSAQFRVNAYVADPYVRLDASPVVEVSVTMKKR